MNNNIRVLSIQSLDQFGREFKRFIVDTREILQSIDKELNRTERYLQDSLNNLHNKVEMYKIEVSEAKTDLRHCLNENDEHDCSSEKERLAQANYNLRQAQTKLQHINKRFKTFKERTIEYQREAKKLKILLDDDLQRGNAALKSLIPKLYQYLDL